MSEQSRTEFEAQYRALQPCARFGRQQEVLGGRYRTLTIQRAWELWQAARALPAGMQPVAWVEHDAGGVSYGVDYAASRKLPERVKHNLYAAAQVLAMGRVPPGWQAVPMQPTEEMRKAGYDAYGVDGCYQSMLAAAPLPAGQLYRVGEGPTNAG